MVLRTTPTQNPTTIALVLLLVVLFVAALAELWTAALAAVTAMLCFNFFFCRRWARSPWPIRRTGSC